MHTYIYIYTHTLFFNHWNHLVPPVATVLYLLKTMRKMHFCPPCWTLAEACKGPDGIKAPRTTEQPSLAARGKGTHAGQQGQEEQVAPLCRACGSTLPSPLSAPCSNSPSQVWVTTLGLMLDVLPKSVRHCWWAILLSWDPKSWRNGVPALATPLLGMWLMSFHSSGLTAVRCVTSACCGRPQRGKCSANY
jgi:hypothetical protein